MAVHQTTKNEERKEWFLW